MTQFEEQLKLLFPEIYELHLLSKSTEQGGGGEAHVWTLIDALLEMNRTLGSGQIFINLNKGHIDVISVKRELLAFKSKRPGY